MGANLLDCNERSMTEGQTGAGRRACGRTRVTVLPLSSVSGGREGARASAIWGYVFAAGFVRRFRESAIDVRPTAAAAAVSCFWKEEKMVFDSGGGGRGRGRGGARGRTSDRSPVDTQQQIDCKGDG